MLADFEAIGKKNEQRPVCEPQKGEVKTEELQKQTVE